MSQSRQPRGTTIGGQFAPEQNPESALILSEGADAVEEPRDFMKELKSAIFEAESEVEMIIGRYHSRAVIMSPDAIEAFDQMAIVVAKQKEIIWELEAQLRSTKSESPTWSDDEIRAEIDRAEVVLRRPSRPLARGKRPPAQPELVLQYTDWHDVAEAVGKLNDAWNATRNSAPEMDEAMGHLYFSYDTPHDEMVKNIVAVQEAWAMTEPDDFDDPMRTVTRAVEALGDFLTSPEPVV